MSQGRIIPLLRPRRWPLLLLAAVEGLILLAVLIALSVLWATL